MAKLNVERRNRSEVIELRKAVGSNGDNQLKSLDEIAKNDQKPVEELATPLATPYIKDKQYQEVNLSGTRGSNPRHPAWEASTLPLSESRK